MDISRRAKIKQRVLPPGGGTKIRWAKNEWSENLREAKFEKNKVDSANYNLRRLGNKLCYY